MRNSPFSGLEQIKYFKQIKMPEIAIIDMGYYFEEKNIVDRNKKLCTLLDLNYQQVADYQKCP